MQKLTQATLLVALLRGGGVPCRLHGFAIHKNLQRGVVPALAFSPLKAWLYRYILRHWMNARVARIRAGGWAKALPSFGYEAKTEAARR